MAGPNGCIVVDTLRRSIRGWCRRGTGACASSVGGRSGASGDRPRRRRILADFITQAGLDHEKDVEELAGVKHTAFVALKNGKGRAETAKKVARVMECDWRLLVPPDDDDQREQVK